MNRLGLVEASKKIHWKLQWKCERWGRGTQMSATYLIDALDFDAILTIPRAQPAQPQHASNNPLTPAVLQDYAFY